MEVQSPVFFASPSELRAWFEQNHETTRELLVGFYKTSSGKPSITWPESVDQALCFGWIDGVRKSIDDTSYTIRFTPRKPRSNWSSVNIKRIGELIELGLVQPAGLKVFNERDQQKSGLYSYEQRKAIKLDPAYEEQLRANTKAWEYFQSRPPSYQQPAILWIMSAKQEETRLRRLATLIECSEQGRTISPLTRPTRTK
ncbi:MAG TPA: YdeI/OmpD-associated family protein [Ktedonobacteraceae bacterium]|nr:YdeI/OmpD-associated family protein [Ktedonobacteraceae bacterium]